MQMKVRNKFEVEIIVKCYAQDAIHYAEKIEQFCDYWDRCYGEQREGLRAIKSIVGDDDIIKLIDDAIEKGDKIRRKNINIVK